MDDDLPEIKAINRIVWRTATSSRLKRFSEILEKEDFQKHFGEKFVEHIAAKIERLFRILLILGLAYTVLMLSLFVAQDAKKTEFEIFGYGFKNLSYHKEFLLLLAAAISPISAVLSAYHRYLTQVRTIALKKIFPDRDVLEFHSHIYAYNFFDPLLGDTRNPHRRPHRITTILAVTFAVVLLTLLVTFVAGSFILQIAVIYDVAANPASARYVNLFVVIFSLTAIGLSWLIGVLQLPLPEVDLSAYTALALLREKDKKKYDETMRRIVKKSAESERIWSIGSAIAFFLLTYLGIAAGIYPSALENFGSLIAKAVPGLILATLVATVIVSAIKRAMHRDYFRAHLGSSDKDLKVFSQLTKTLRVIRLGLPAIFSIAYSFWWLRG